MADGSLPLYRMTVDQFERALKAGLYADRPVEFRDGLVLELPATLTLHARTRRKLANAIEAAMAETKLPFEVCCEISIRFDDWFPTPDILVWDLKRQEGAVLPDEVRIVVEVADETFKDDSQEKRPRYAARGVPELWLVDVRRRRILIATGPASGGYRHEDWTDYGAPIISRTLPGLVVPTDALPIVDSDG